MTLISEFLTKSKAWKRGYMDAVGAGLPTSTIKNPYKNKNMRNEWAAGWNARMWEVGNYYAIYNV